MQKAIQFLSEKPSSAAIMSAVSPLGLWMRIAQIHIVRIEGRWNTLAQHRHHYATGYDQVFHPTHDRGSTGCSPRKSCHHKIDSPFFQLNEKPDRVAASDTLRLFLPDCCTITTSMSLVSFIPFDQRHKTVDRSFAGEFPIMRLALFPMARCLASIIQARPCLAPMVFMNDVVKDRGLFGSRWAITYWGELPHSIGQPTSLPSYAWSRSYFIPCSVPAGEDERAHS